MDSSDCIHNGVYVYNYGENGVWVCNGDDIFGDDDCEYVFYAYVRVLYDFYAHDEPFWQLMERL
ncbi:MAG: hypothetical protein GTO02_11285 [Candidatus Dadabacteria bacterium]|nr:hypothetical protein [Candidatus Dadabacteria bacterium]NIQ14942.1 hypothetical protein [Candidatus Dadabacteria bacterium]